jgi:ADP-heptose:LPS heptosyltransferase
MMFSQKKVVMITPERLGDTLMCTPAIHYLKSQCPEIEIHVIALSDLSAEVLQNNPAIHKIYILPSYKFIRSLKDYFDFGINIHYGKVVQNYMELIKSFSIPIFEIPKVKPLFHQAEQCLEFMQSIVSENPEISERSYKLYPDDKDKKHIEALFNVKKIDPKKDILIGCQIGCHSLAKKRIFFRKNRSHPKIWPLEHIQTFAKFCEQHNPNIKIIITGSQNEKKLAKKLVKNSSNIADFVNETSVPQLHVLLQQLRLFISPDTGLMHVACSANVPLIALFGPTELRRTGPYPELSDLTLIQAPTMAEILPESVFKIVTNKLNSLSVNY